VKAVLAFALLLLGAMGGSVVNAQDQSFTTRGAGTTSCGTYIEWRNSGDKPRVTQVVQWTWGYLHGYNAFTLSATIVPPELDTVAAYLEKYCRDNPLEFVADSIPNLISDLGGSRTSPKRRQ
jgi:hypothetical protein